MQKQLGVMWVLAAAHVALAGPRQSDTVTTFAQESQLTKATLESVNFKELHSYLFAEMLNTGNRAVTKELSGTGLRLKVAPRQITTPDAVIVVVTDDGEQRIQLDLGVFAGQIEGMAQSQVVFAVTPQAINGRVVVGNEEFRITQSSGSSDIVVSGPVQRNPPSNSTASNLKSSPDDPADDNARPHHGGSFGTSDSPTSIDEWGSSVPPQPLRRVRVALETDYEFYRNVFQGRPLDAALYAGQILAGISEILTNDMNLEAQLCFLRIWATASDPWPDYFGTNSSGTAYSQDYTAVVQGYWMTHPQAVDQQAILFLSGRTAGAGIAIGQIGNPVLIEQGLNIDFGHVASGTPTAAPDATFGGAAGQSGHWMNITADMGATGVFVEGLDGVATGIKLKRTTGSVTTGTYNSSNTSQDHEALLDDYHRLNGSVTYVFENVPSGVWSLYTYGVAPDSAVYQTRVTVQNSLNNYYLPYHRIGGSLTPNQFLEGTTHSEHHVIPTGSPQSIVVTVTDSTLPGALPATINGFQLRRPGNLAIAMTGLVDGLTPFPLQTNHADNHDIYIAAHEFGHCLGAPHTHGATPQVDDCPNDCTNASTLGTIMSYCVVCPGENANIALTYESSIINNYIIPSLTQVNDFFAVPDACLADLDCNGTVESADSTIHVANWGMSVPRYTNGDMNGDSTVNSADFWLLLALLGDNCTAGCQY